MKRIRKTAPLINTREDAERLAGEISQLIIERTARTNQIDEAVNRARAEHESRLTALAKAIDEKTDLLRAWADANRDEFGQRKSLDFLHAVIGFRTGTPKLKTRSPWTWASVLENLCNHWDSYVRTKAEPDKTLIIADHAKGELTNSDLVEMGLQVVQDEAFFIEPKLETPAEK